MAKPLITDWLRVFVSGKTIDGRRVEPEWVDSMAATYDPAEYEAVITREHLLYLGNYGTVEAARAVDWRNRRALEVKLRPNRRLLELRAEGNGLYGSVWIGLDYPRDKDRYLRGLATTDTPASAGMQRWEFKTADGVFEMSDWLKLPEGDVFGVFDNLSPAELEKFNSDVANGSAKGSAGERAITREIVEGFKRFFTTGGYDAPNKEDEPMTKEELEKFEALSKKVEDMTAEMERFKSSDAADEKADGAKAEAGAQDSAAFSVFAGKFDKYMDESKNLFTAMKERLDKQDTTFAGLDERFKKYEKFAAKRTSDETPETTKFPKDGGKDDLGY